MLFHTISLVLGAILDLLIGDPHSMPHPVRAIGSLILFLEKILLGAKQKAEDRDPEKEKRRGALLWLIVVAAATAVTALIVGISYRVSRYLGVLVETVLTCYILAAGSLYRESMAVFRELQKGDLDAARSALRIGAEKVYIMYRRSEEELPARREEVHHAKEEGVEFMMLTNPVEIIGNDEDFVKAVKCQKMTLGEPDAGGRRRPVVVPDSEFVLDADCVIMAIGTSPNPLIKSTTKGLETQKWGGIIVDENGKTTREGVFAGGDAVTGAATVILAMGEGKTAAKAIDEYIQKRAL